MDRDKVLEFLRQEFPNGHRKFYEILLDLMDLHNRKNADYATRNDPLANFKRVGEWARQYKLVTEGNEALKVAIIYSLKQMDAAFKLVGDGDEGGVESVNDRLKDVAVYAVLEMLINEECT